MTRDSMIKQNSISVCQVFKKKTNKNNPSPCQMTSSHEHSALGPGGTTAHPGINPFSCLRPYVSTISVSKITFTTTAAGCLQKLKLLWYTAAYVCMLFGPIDNTWACCACFFFFFLTKGRCCHMHGRINEDLNWQHHLPNTVDVKRMAPTQHFARLSGGCHIVISANTKY